MQVAHRHKQILHFIPELPKSISTKSLLAKLDDEQVKINLRMLQRDLEHLYCTETNFVKNKVGQDNQWSFEQGTKTAQIMTPSMALAFNMLADYAKHLLPTSVNKQLQGHFNQAKRTLTDPKLAIWQSKIATIPAGFQLHKADINTEILNTVEQAIIDQAQLEIEYLNRPNIHTLHNHTVKKRLINPLGLVIRGNVYYLIASTPENELRNFALHRMSSAQKSHNTVQLTNDFNLEEYVAEGNLTFSNNQTINLELKVKRIPGYHLLETPLSPDQQVIDIDEHHFMIKATLNDNAELHWWLMSLADISEVIAPQSLRDIMIGNLQKAMEMYS